MPGQHPRPSARLLLACLLLGGLGNATSAHAQAVASPPVFLPIANPSFEALQLPPGGYRTGEIAGWQRIGGSPNHVGLQSFSPALFAAPSPSEQTLPAPAEGRQFAFINQPSDGGEIALYQVLGALRPHTRYTFTLAIGNRLDKGYSDYVLLELCNGETPASPVLASARNSAGPADGTFADHSVSFTTGSYVTGPLLIVIRNQSGYQIVFDHARVTTESTRPASVIQP